MKTVTRQDAAPVRAFIEARLTEEELAAWAARPGDWFAASEPGTARLVGAADGAAVAVCSKLDTEPAYDNAPHIALQNADRTLLRTAVIRGILVAVDKYLDPHPGQPCTNRTVEGHRTGGPCDLHVAATGRVSVEVLPRLAAIWATHPDYDERWLAALDGDA
jgi:hypothetical protein